MSDLAKQFEKLWESNDSPPDVFEFVEQHNGLDAVELLPVLLADQSHRWKTEKPFKVEDYLEHLPNISSDPEFKLQLALGEFQARQNGDTAPSIDEFASRFPDIGDSLRAKLSELTPDNDEGIRVTTTKSYITDRTIGDKQVGRYRLVRLLGEGAFGQVFLGFDEELQRQVAIKVPTPERFHKPEDAEAYLAEARTVASLNHPNIVPVYDTGRTEDGSIYVVSKFIDGCTLDQKINVDDPSHDDAAKLLATIAAALDHAHKKRLIHRDVKPSNILIEESTGTSYIADFGLAISEEDYLRDTRIAGTPAFMSPEQARGEGHRLDGRSDIFSLGVILYLMLTGRRPFRGETQQVVLCQVIANDPKPPREIKDSIPVELERICLRALSKRVSDRYATAAELADDLLNWNKASQQERKELQIVPKGLRSFDEEDAEFFLDLLPGPRNRNGLPESIQFWKTRIEEADPDRTFSVGLIYGPSGCGKSSLVKAGLLPRLSKDVVPIYVEATPEETETRILRGLRKRFPGLPEDASLSETFSLIRRSDDPKVVIILDQFEQWLHAHRAEQETELVSALRQCDGGKIQAVVMVRDDFWMASSRFGQEIEVKFHDGENAAVVDLFSERHAKKVLFAFGRAYKQTASQPTDDQRAFVEEAVAGLSIDGKVVSVQIALLADMLKDKEWSRSTLDTLGGTEGIGVTFLDETFSARTAPAENRQHQQAARGVLKALLPEIGSDIKGHMRSHDELLEVSGYQNRHNDFYDLLRILDGELRLITPTDPEGFETESGSDPGSKFYQLTHDYLVPSLREWLTRKQRETRKGRAELKLEERSALWNAKPENRHLPSMSEWVSIKTLTEKKKWTEPQRKLMGKAGQVHGIRSATVLAALVAIVVGGITIRNVFEEERKSAEATQIVNGLVKADTSEVKNLFATQLADYREYAKDDLKKAFDQSADDSNAKLHAALAMLPDDKSVLPTLRGRLLTVTPMQFEHVRDLLEADKNQLVESYWEVAKSNETPALRFQAACALATYDPDNEYWQDEAFCRFIADHLTGVRPSDLLPWTNALRPVKEQLIDPLSTIYRNSEAGEQVRSFATDTLADYLSHHADGLFDLLADSNEKQFGTIFDNLDIHREKVVDLGNAEVAKSLPEDASEKDKESLAMRQANAAVMLLRMNAPDQVWPLLKHSPDPRVRSYIIHWLSPRGGRASTIIGRYEQESDVTIKRALLLCLGEFDLAQEKPLILNVINDSQQPR